jgi:uncharacterized OB-fold protein
MANYEYRGQLLSIPDNDSEYRGYFEAAGEHKLVVKKCGACGLLRGEPGPACPWCPSLDWEWVKVSGKGTIYSYQIVAHTVVPALKDLAPFAIVLVELDEQSGKPTEEDGLRIVANLLTDDMKPEKEENVAIGARVEVIFDDEPDGIRIPHEKLSGEPPKGETWRHVF